MAAAASPRSSSPWVQGPFTDYAFGAALIYLPVLLLSLPAGPNLSIGGFSLMPFLVIFIANTHLGATLLRTYERPQDRHAYRLFAVWVTAAIVLSCPNTNHRQ